MITYEHLKACLEVVLWFYMSVICIGILIHYMIKFFEDSAKYLNDCERRMDTED